MCCSGNWRTLWSSLKSSTEFNSCIFPSVESKTLLEETVISAQRWCAVGENGYCQRHLQNICRESSVCRLQLAEKTGKDLLSQHCSKLTWWKGWENREVEISAEFSALRSWGFWNGLCSILKGVLEISKQEASQILLGEITLLHFVPQACPVGSQTPQEFANSSPQLC